MAKQNVIDKKNEVRKNLAVVTETVETSFTAEDLERQIAQWDARMLKCQNDFYASKTQRDEFQALYDQLNVVKPDEELEV